MRRDFCVISVKYGRDNFVLDAIGAELIRINEMV